MKRVPAFVILLIIVAAGIYFYSRTGTPENSGSEPNAAAAHSAPSPEKGPVTPSKYDCSGCNVVVILVDTLRADHLPFYGYEKETAPFLSSVAENSVIFERAFSASSWTAPATATVFTSLYPSQHGVITGFAATKQLQKRDYEIQMNRIPMEIQTLGEYMADAGFITVAVTDNLNIGPEMGFDRGFKYFTQYRYKGAEAVNKMAVEYMDKVKDEGRYFLYLHYMDPHSPYNKQEPFFSECMQGVEKDRKQRELCSYDSEIHYVDGKLGELFERYQFLQNSIVIFLSDHGEEFWEHGGTGHGKTLYSEVIHVPLFLYHPKIGSRRIKKNVHTMDILPTLSSLLEVAPNKEWVGENLVTYIEGGGDPERPIIADKIRHPAIAEKRTKRRWTKRSVVESDWHYIQTEDPGKELGKELFDLEKDFAEQNNISQNHPAITEDLKTALDQYPDDAWQQYDEGIQMDVDPEMLEQLRTLGYVD